MMNSNSQVRVTYLNKTEVFLFRFIISFAIGFCLGFPLAHFLPPHFLHCALPKTWNGHQVDTKQGNIHIGMMSSDKTLNTRAEAAVSTWAKQHNISIEVFANNNGTSNMWHSYVESFLRSQIRIIQLAGVSDRTYPPQKKSFAMIKFMHDMYLDKFDWFVRLDDDAYVDFEKLQLLLNRVNSSKPFYIGSPGFGKHDDDYIAQGESYCMGGPGMVFSKELLRRLAPNLKSCLLNLLTEHEDVELGRCVTKATDQRCTTSLEAGRIFMQVYGHGKQVTNIKEVTSNQLVYTFCANMKPSPDFAESLIIQVEKYRCIYDMKHKSYHNKMMTRNAWREITKALEVPDQVAECKTVWKNLKDQFRRWKAKLQNSHSGDGASSIKKWALYDLMSFMEPYIQERKTSSNFTDQDIQTPPIYVTDGVSGDKPLMSLDPETGYIFITSTPSATEDSVSIDGTSSFTATASPTPCSSTGFGNAPETPTTKSVPTHAGPNKRGRKRKAADELDADTTAFLNAIRESNAGSDEGIVFHCNKNPAYQYNFHALKLQRKIAIRMAAIYKMEKEIRKNFKPTDARQTLLSNVQPELVWNALVDFKGYEANDGNMYMTNQLMLKDVLSYSKKKLTENLKQRDGQPLPSRVDIEESYFSLNSQFSFDILSTFSIFYATPHHVENKVTIQRKYISNYASFFNEPFDVSLNLNTTVNFVVTVVGNSDNVFDFIKGFENNFVKKKENVRLFVIYFSDKNSTNAEGDHVTQKALRNIVNALNRKYSDSVVTLRSRKQAMPSSHLNLEIANDNVADIDEILYFCDVNSYLNPRIIERIRRNTIQGKRVYVPVVFNRYSLAAQRNASMRIEAFQLDENAGFWHNFKDETFAIYKSDFDKITKDPEILKQDNHLISTLLKAKFDIFYSHEPAALRHHLPHPCSSQMSTADYHDCFVSRTHHCGSKTFLYRLYKKFNADNHDSVKFHQN